MGYEHRKKDLVAFSWAELVFMTCWMSFDETNRSTPRDQKSAETTVGERPAFPKTFSKINTAYRILHHTLIKHREMMISIS
jgi:hypothetical protein